MQDRAYHFKRLLQKLESRGVGLKILVLEAPPQLDIALPEGSDIGLMQPDISESHETIFASAVFPGRWAAPGPQGAASPFTRAVSKAMREPGLMLAQVFDVAKQDKALTQTPYVMDVLRQQQQFYFHPPVKTPDWPRPGMPVSNRNDREEYLWIRPGRFLMGCVPGDSRCSASEKPQHEVTITKGYWMGRNEVQVGSYQRYVKAKGVKMPSAPIYDRGWKVSDQPVVNVRWEDAAAYCTFAGGRLPTEAEWEMAARAGKANQVYPMSSEESSRDKANFNGQKGNDIFEYVAPVRKFDPNPFGLYDLAGNVWEFVADFFSPAYYTAAAMSDPQGPTSGKDRVIRGGSYDADPKEHLRISYRRGFSGTAPGVGFRCVLEDTPETRKILIEPPK
jgi:formylglycine-generating enzyme required for sulfatase activity